MVLSRRSTFHPATTRSTNKKPESKPKPHVTKKQTNTDPATSPLIISIVIANGSLSAPEPDANVSSPVSVAPGTSGPAVVTASPATVWKPYADEDFYTDEAEVASFGVNRGGRGHFGRWGPVIVRANLEISVGKSRFAGGVVATEETGETSGTEAVESDFTAVIACRNGIRDKCLKINKPNGLKNRCTVI